MAIIYDIFTGKVLENIVKVQDTKGYKEIASRIEARFGDKLPAHFKRSMAKPQKQPYMHGDVHNVSYKPKTRLFNKPMPVPCEVTLKSCVKINGELILGSKCELGIDEPFPWMDNKYQVTLNFLKSLPNKTKLTIYTRSDLVATEEYVDELKRLNVEVNMLYFTNNEELTRQLEPGAPSVKRRKTAVYKLHECGIVAHMKRHYVNVAKDTA